MGIVVGFADSGEAMALLHLRHKVPTELRSVVRLQHLELKGCSPLSLFDEQDARPTVDVLV